MLEGLTDLEPGALVAIRGRLLLVDEDAVSVLVGRNYTVSVPHDDVVSVLPPETPPEPLKAGDTVRDLADAEWSVMADPRVTDAGDEQVALWSDEMGVSWDYVRNLTRVENDG